MRIQSCVLMVVACCATDVLAVEFTGTIESNLVFAAGETVEVAAGDAAYAMGTFRLGGTANGTIYKTGGGTFNLSTAVINGKANGDSADGGKAYLSVTGGTFRINTPTAVNSTFSGSVTVGENGALEMDSGTVSTPQLTMGGGAFRMTGGTFTTKKVTGSGLIDIAGGTFTVLATNKFTVTGPMRVNLTGDGTLRSNTLVGGEGAEISLHVDGGTLYPLPETSSGSHYEGGTAYVGRAGMTIDTGDYYAWGVYWNLPIRSESGVTDGGVTIMSSTYSDASVHGMFRFVTDDIDIAGPIRVNNAQVMLLGEHYTAPIILDNRSVVRAAVSPVVEVDRLEYTGDTGNMIVGINQTTLKATLLQVDNFTPPKQILGVTWYRSSTTSVDTPTNTVDFLKFPASVDLPLSRVAGSAYRSGFSPRFTMRTEGEWKILSLTAVPAAEVSAGANDPHTSDAWMESDSPWCLTNCLYSYTGGTRTVAGQMLADPASYRRNASISIPADVTLTLTGGADQQNGGIVKMGEGTLVLTGDVGYNFSRNFSCYTALKPSLSQANLGMFNENNICVRTHHGSLNVGAGTLTIGTGADNPQVSAYEGELNVGTATVSTDGGEKDAMLVMNSGTLAMPKTPITIGYGHGIAATQAHSPLLSSFTLNGGYVDAWATRLGYDVTERSAQDSRLIINGGTYLCRRWMALGTNTVTAGSVATLVVNDGTLDIGATAVAQGAPGDLVVGYPGNTNLSTEFTVNGGEVTIHGGASFAPNAHHTVNLNGGTLFVKGGDFTSDASAGSSVLNWNGGVLKLGDAKKASGFKTVNIGARGAIVDASEAGERCSLVLPLSGTGPLILRGAGYRTSVLLAKATIFSDLAGLVVEDGGNALLGAAVPETCPVLVKNGGTLSAYYSSGQPKFLTLGETESDVTTLLCYEYTGYYPSGCVIATGTLTINGKVYIGGREPSHGQLVFSPNPDNPGGRFAVLRTPAGELSKYSADKFELHPDLVARGAAATFEITTSKGYDYLYATVITPPQSVWTAGTSGLWSENANWDVAPTNGGGNRVTFPATLDDDITVTLPSTTIARHFVQNSTNCVTIAGPLTTSTYGTYTVAETNGVLEFSGPAVKIGDPFKSGGQGTLRFTGKITTSAPEIQANAGRLEGAPECFGTAKLLLNNSTVRFTESGTFAGQIIHTDTDTNGVGVEVMGDKVVYATSVLNNHSALQKTGPGTIVFCRTGTKASVTNVVGQSAKSATTYPYSNGLNGAVPNGAALGIYAGKVVFDGDTKTKYSVWDTQTWVGQYPIPDGTGGAYDACLEVRGGTLTLAGLLIGVHPKKASMAGTATAIGLTRSQKAIVNVKGGTLRVADGTFVMGYTRYSTSIISELNVSGGLLEVCGSSTSFGIGYHDSSNVVDAAELSATINISGDGIFRKLSPGSFKFGKDRNNGAYLHNVALNMTGGRLESPENDLDVLYNAVKARVNLAGGVLDVLKIVQNKNEGTSGATIDFHFNGGTYRPNAAESTFPAKPMTSLTVGEGGAKFDLIENNLLTLATQPLVTAEGVEQDGGITLDATGDAVLTLSVSNAFNGPIVVNGGKVVPLVPEAVNCATGVVVNGAGVFDANGMALTFGTLGGDGLYTNGTVTVTDAVEPVGSSLAVESLVLADGATLRCPVTGDAQSGFSVPCFAAGSVVGQGTVWLDLGLAADAPPPRGTRVLIARVPEGSGFPCVRFRNPGWTKSTVSLSRVTADGYTEIWAEVVPRAMVLTLR